MRLRTKTLISLVVVIVLAITITTIQLWITNDSAKAMEQRGIAIEISGGILDLNILTSQYLLYHNDRALIQWELEYKSLVNLLSDIKLKASEGRVIIEEITNDLDDIHSSFGHIITNYERQSAGEEFANYPALTEAYATQVLIKSQSLEFHTEQLSDLYGDVVAKSQRISNALTISSFIVIVAALLLFFLLVWKQILTSLSKLKKGTDVIATGNLDYQIDIPSHDEIGDISSSFNQMTARLKQSMTALQETVATLEIRVLERTKELEEANQSLQADITERKQAEEELKLRAELLDNASDSIFLRDLDENFVYVNETALRVLGYSREEFLKLKVQQIIAPGYIWVREHMLQELQEKGEITFETADLHKDGSMIPMEVHARLIESGGKKLIISIIRDITERQKMQENLVVTDRLAALGEMALGFSHELNNPLTAIIGYSQLLLDDKNLTGNTRTDLERIYSQAQRMTAVIKKFLVFARKKAPMKQPTDINSVINTILKMREYEDKIINITVITNLNPDLPAVMADVSQLQQVFLNIVINAEYFMLKAHNKGTLTVTTERTGDMVKASFTNDGPEISKDNLTNIFNPFFTTKEVGQGTGLGLSICHSIIREHGGRIYAENEPGKGVTFWVELPVAK